MAYGKRDVLTKELIVGIFLTALGESAISVIVIKGSKVLVRRASLRVFQKIVALLGGRITQQALKASISKWAPGIGAGAMALWSHHQTKQIGNKAVEIFEKDIVLSNDPIDGNPPSKQEPPSNGVVSARRLEVLRLQAMINLMKADGIVRAEEREFMRIIISNTTLTEEEKSLLINHMETGEKFTIDYAAIADSPEDTVGLLIDLITLAKRDGSVHVAEKMYIKQVGRLMGFSDHDIEEMLESVNNQDRSHISTRRVLAWRGKGAPCPNPLLPVRKKGDEGKTGRRTPQTHITSLRLPPPPPATPGCRQGAGSG